MNNSMFHRLSIRIFLRPMSKIFPVFLKSDSSFQNENSMRKISIRVSKLNSPRESKNFFVLTGNEAEKNFYLHMFSRLSERISTLKEENRLVRLDDFILTKKSFVLFLALWKFHQQRNCRSSMERRHGGRNSR